MAAPFLNGCLFWPAYPYCPYTGFLFCYAYLTCCAAPPCFRMVCAIPFSSRPPRPRDFSAPQIPIVVIGTPYHLLAAVISHIPVANKRNHICIFNPRAWEIACTGFPFKISHGHSGILLCPAPPLSAPLVGKPILPMLFSLTVYSPFVFVQTG